MEQGSQRTKRMILEWEEQWKGGSVEETQSIMGIIID